MGRAGKRGLVPDCLTGLEAVPSDAKGARSYAEFSQFREAATPAANSTASHTAPKPAKIVSIISMSRLPSSRSMADRP
jgi:hypothetical protein